MRDHLTSLGWRVDVFNPTPRGDARHPQPELPQLDGVELAVMLVRDSGPVDVPLNRRILLLAGELKGALGERKMVAFIEETSEPVLAGTGISVFRFERNNLDVHLPQVVSMLGQGPVHPAQPVRGPRVSTPWLERFGVDGRVSAGTLVALGVLIIVASVIGVIGYQLSDTSRGRLSAEVAGTGGTAAADRGSSGSPTEGGADRLLPLGPADVGSVRHLPAVCVIETPRDAVLDETIECDDGMGGVVVGGNRGPWHNEIRGVALDLGVLGQAIMEARPDRTNAVLVELESGGVSDLEGNGSASGIDRLVFVFAANGQEVELLGAGPENGDSATLTYRLDVD